MALNLKTKGKNESPLVVPMEYDSVDLTEDDDDYDIPVDLSQSSQSSNHFNSKTNNSFSFVKNKSNNNYDIIANENNYVIKINSEDDGNYKKHLNYRVENNYSPKTKEPVMTFKNVEEYEKSIKMLEKELKDEETKLILLKNIRCSQLQQQQQQNNTSAQSNNNKSVIVNGKVSVINTNSSSNNNNNKPKDNQQQQHRNNASSSGCNNNNNNNNANNGSKLLNGGSNKKGTSVTQQNQQQKSGSSQHQQNNQQPKSHNNVLPGTKTSLANSHHQQQATSHNMLSSTSTSIPTSSSAALNSSHYSQLQEQQLKLFQQRQQAAAAILVEQTAAKKLSDAKLAVRKQLERTLLQLPSLKSNPFDLSLVPNSGSGEFTMLLGLEQVVNRLLENSNDDDKKQSDQSNSGEIDKIPEQSPAVNSSSSADSSKPRNEVSNNCCHRCKTDFTTKWIQVPGSSKSGKGSKTSSSLISCESCFRLERKRTVAKQQEERMNTAFLRSKQQEWEVEKALSSELEAARQQIEAINNSLASAVPIVPSVFPGKVIQSQLSSSSAAAPTPQSSSSSFSGSATRDRSSLSTASASTNKSSNQVQQKQQQQQQQQLFNDKPAHRHHHSTNQNNRNHHQQDQLHSKTTQSQQQQQQHRLTTRQQQSSSSASPSLIHPNTAFHLPTFPTGIDLERLMLYSEKMAAFGSLFNHFAASSNSNNNPLLQSSSSSSPSSLTSVMKQQQQQHNKQRPTPYSRP